MPGWHVIVSQRSQLSRKTHLVLLDQTKFVLLEEGGAAIDGVRVAGVDLHCLLLVHRAVAVLQQLGLQEVVEVVALDLLHGRHMQ